MKFNKKIASVMLVSTMLISTSFSFAASFKDMKTANGADHWSISYVTDMTAKGMINGYSDGTFKPNKAVTRLESIVFVSRFFPAQTISSTYTANKSKYEEALNINAIPEYARPAIVFGLENKWYTQAYLKEFMNVSTKTQKEAKRYEFVVYLVRALGWDSEMSNAAVVKYKDANSIPKQAIPYIEVLAKKGVVVDTGNFNPQKSVTRGEVAKMMSVAYSLSNKNTTPTPTPTTKPIMPSGNVVEGQIRQITLDNNNLIITVVDKFGNSNLFTNRTTGVIVARNNEAILPKALKEGQSVRLYTDGTTVKGIEVLADKVESTPVNKKMSGEIYSINMSNNTIKIKSGNVIEEYTIASNVSVTKDKRTANQYALKFADAVEIEIKDSKIISIDAQTVKRTMKNVIIKAVTSYVNGTATVTIQDEAGETHQLEYTQDTIAYKSNKVVSLSALSVGYEADVYIIGNEILDMTIFGRTQGTLLIGVITYLDIRNDIIYVTTKDNKEIKVIFDKNVEVLNQYTNKQMSIYDLEKNQNVIINGYEGNGIFEGTRIAYY